MDLANLWVSGVETDSMTMGMRFNLEGGTGAGNQRHPDRVEPNTWLGASSIFTYEGYSGSGKATAGVKFVDDKYKAIYLGFGFEAIDSDSLRRGFMKNAIDWLTRPSGIGWGDKGGNLPKSSLLSQNYPNPFNSTTLVHYTLSAASGQRTAVKLEIYNILGEKVATLVDKGQAPGSYSVRWDARDMASGIYLCRLQVDGKTSVRKMILLR